MNYAFIYLCAPLGAHDNKPCTHLMHRNVHSLLTKQQWWQIALFITIYIYTVSLHGPLARQTTQRMTVS